MTLNVRNFLRALFVAVAALGVTSAADASFRLRIDDGSGNTGIVLTDTSLTGVINYNGAIDSNFKINVTTGLSKPALPTPGSMDLSSVNVASLGAGTIRIWLEDTGFASTGPNMTVGASIGGTLNAGGASTIKAQAFAYGNNSVFNFGPDHPAPFNPIAGVTMPAGFTTAWASPFTSGPGAFSGTSGNNFSTGGTYALVEMVQIDFKAAGSASFDFSVTTVPEPTSIVMAVTGLGALAVGGLTRRLRREKAPQA